LHLFTVFKGDIVDLTVTTDVHFHTFGQGVDNGDTHAVQTARELVVLLVLFFYAVLPDTHTDWLWRLILGFGAIPALVIIAIRSRYMSESPVWAANQGNLKEAATILRQSYNINAHVPQDALNQPAPVVNKAKWQNYLNLFRGVYLRRTTLATLLSVVSSFAYNAVAFGLPVIISSFFVQSMLTTILISLVLNLLFAFVGGLLAVRLVPHIGAW
jgi:hypothetical protein